MNRKGQTSFKLVELNKEYILRITLFMTLKMVRKIGDMFMLPTPGYITTENFSLPTSGHEYMAIRYNSAQHSLLRALNDLEMQLSVKQGHIRPRCSVISALPYKLHKVLGDCDEHHYKYHGLR